MLSLALTSHESNICSPQELLEGPVRQGALPKGTGSHCQTLGRRSPPVPQFPHLWWMNISYYSVNNPIWQFENQPTTDTASQSKTWYFISCLGQKQNLAPWKERVDIFKQKNWNTHSYCEKNLFFLSNLTNSMITNRNRAKRHKGLGLDQAAQEKVLSCR